MFRHEKVFAMERNCIVGQKIYNINVFSFDNRNFVTPIIESVRKPARITPYPTGRLFWGDAVPGTSCQATIAPSLRDISQQALVSAAGKRAGSRRVGRAAGYQKNVGQSSTRSVLWKNGDGEILFAWRQIRLAISRKSTKRIDNMLREYGQERSRRQ